MTPGFGINSDKSMYEHDLQQPDDRFDQCDERHPRTGERCTGEAGHDRHSWESISLHDAQEQVRDEVRQDFKCQKERGGLGDDEMWASGTRFVVPMRPFIWAMFAEMEVNEYKSAPDLWHKVEVPVGMGEIFYHVLKLAWLVKHRPEDKSAILEFTADVANCAFILAASMGAAEKGVPAPEQETRLGGIGGVDDFYKMFDQMKEWILEHLGWTEEQMAFHPSDEQPDPPPGDEREDGSVEHQWV